MFAGRFNRETGRPQVAGSVLLFGRNPTRSVQPVWFVVDTGSDKSFIGPKDAANLGVDRADLLRGYPTFGIAGSITPFVVPGAIVLGQDATNDGFGFVLPELEVATLDIVDSYVPSLLGRDVLDRLRMVYDPSVEGLLFEVRSSDFEFEDPAGTAR